MCPDRSISIRRIATSLRPYLAQGGVEPFERCAVAFHDVDHVVLLAPDARVEIVAPQPIVFELEDLRSDLLYLPELHELADMLAECVQAHERVAVLCRQGRNRSGLLSGLVLNKLGMPGRQAVARIRKKRRHALSGGGGPAFAKYLSTLP